MLLHFIANIFIDLIYSPHICRILSNNPPPLLYHKVYDIRVFHTASVVRDYLESCPSQILITPYGNLQACAASHVFGRGDVGV